MACYKLGVRLLRVSGALLACSLIAGACSATPDTAAVLNSAETEEPTNAAGELEPADAEAGTELLGCGVGLELEPTAETETRASESTDSFVLGDAAGHDSDSWVVADLSNPAGLRFQVWLAVGEFGEDQVFEEAVGDFEYMRYGDSESQRDDRAVFNGVTGRLTDDNAAVAVLTLNGSNQDTRDFLASLDQLIDGASSIGDLTLVRSGVPSDVLEAATLAETFEWRDDNTRILAQHVCGPAVAEGELELADALTLASAFRATRTWVTGEESVTPITIGDSDGFLLDIDEGSNDDYLVGVVGSAERAVVLTIIDTGADLDLGLSIVARLSLEPR